MKRKYTPPLSKRSRFDLMNINADITWANGTRLSRGPREARSADAASTPGFLPKVNFLRIRNNSLERCAER